MEHYSENNENSSLTPYDKINALVCSSPNKVISSSVLKPHNLKTDDCAIKDSDKNAKKIKALQPPKDKVYCDLLLEVLVVLLYFVHL